MMDALTPGEVVAIMLTVGEKKVKQRYIITFFKAFMAGWMVVTGAMLYSVFNGSTGTLHTDYPGLITLIGAFFFPVGLIMLVLTGQELLTANFMVLVMTSIKRRTKLWELPLNWFIVFFGNLAGALCWTVFLAHYSDVYSTPALVTYSAGVAVTKTSLGWGVCVLRGIGCNFLVCTSYWLGTSSREMVSKIVALHFPIFLFVFLGFEHVIVNMYYIPLGMLNGANVSIGTYISQSLIPSFIGNVIGGCLLGVPMLLFYEGYELPVFNKFETTPSVDNSSNVVTQDVGAGPGINEDKDSTN